MTDVSGDDVAALARTAREAGVTASVHASRLGGPPSSIGLDHERTVAIASLYKLPLALVWADLAESGGLDPAAAVRLSAAARMPGPTGIAMLLDEVTVSQRDLVRLMLSISDNAAGDAVLELVGRDRAHQRLVDLDLPTTLIRQGSAEETRAVMRDTGAESWLGARRVLADPGLEAHTSQYDPAYASASSAEQVTAVLAHLWARRAPIHALVRDALAHQAWRHRIASGFPHDDVVVSGKTGSLGRLRHEAAVVEFPHEHPVAVTVLTYAARPEQHLPRVDAAIGSLARQAVAMLRLPDTVR